MLGDARLASDMSDALLKRGIYVIGFSYPVVPQEGEDRDADIAAHDRSHLDTAIQAFVEVGPSLGSSNESAGEVEGRAWSLDGGGT